jgi:hypothetical protein
MWAQYAERHAGVCLILDREAIGREIGESLGTKYKLYCGRVQYRTWYDPRDFQFSLDGLLKCGYAECISELISQHHAGLWFTKTVDWEQEHEYRYVLVKPPSDVDDQIYVSIEHSLKAVVLGADIKPRNRVRVIKYGKQLGIDVAQMDWYNGHPSVLPVFIPPGPDAPAQPLP